MPTSLAKRLLFVIAGRCEMPSYYVHSSLPCPNIKIAHPTPHIRARELLDASKFAYESVKRSIAT